MVNGVLSRFKELYINHFIIIWLLVIMIKPTRCTNFWNLFWNETLHVSDNSFVHPQEFFTVHAAMVYVIQVMLTACEQEQMLLLTSCQRNYTTYTIAVCTVKNSWWWTKELSETCRVSFQNKFEKLVHLVGFMKRIFRDARSYEPKIRMISYCIRICSVFFRNAWSQIRNTINVIVMIAFPLIA